MWDVPPTGESFAVQQVHWFRVADGKVAQHSAVRDALGMLRQLGVIPDTAVPCGSANASACRPLKRERYASVHHFSRIR